MHAIHPCLSITSNANPRGGAGHSSGSSRNTRSVRQSSHPATLTHSIPFTHPNRRSRRQRQQQAVGAAGGERAAIRGPRRPRLHAGACEVRWLRCAALGQYVVVVVVFFLGGGAGEGRRGCVASSVVGHLTHHTPPHATRRHTTHTNQKRVGGDIRDGAGGRRDLPLLRCQAGLLHVARRRAGDVGGGGGEWV